MNKEIRNRKMEVLKSQKEEKRIKSKTEVSFDTDSEASSKSEAELTSSEECFDKEASKSVKKSWKVNDCDQP